MSPDCTHASAGHAAASMAAAESAADSVAGDSVTAMVADNKSRFDCVAHPVQSNAKNNREKMIIPFVYFIEVNCALQANKC